MQFSVKMPGWCLQPSRWVPSASDRATVESRARPLCRRSSGQLFPCPYRRLRRWFGVQFVLPARRRGGCREPRWRCCPKFSFTETRLPGSGGNSDDGARWEAGRAGPRPARPPTLRRQYRYQRAARPTVDPAHPRAVVPVRHRRRRSPRISWIKVWSPGRRAWARGSFGRIIGKRLASLTSTPAQPGACRSAMPAWPRTGLLARLVVVSRTLGRKAGNTRSAVPPVFTVGHRRTRERVGGRLPRAEARLLWCACRALVRRLLKQVKRCTSVFGQRWWCHRLFVVPP